MNTSEIFNLFLIVSALHGFAFSLIMFFSKFGRTKSMVFLNLMMLSISLNNFQSWCYIDHTTNIFFEASWHFLSAPLFYTFLITYLQINKQSINLLWFFVGCFFIISMIQLGFIFYLNDKNPYHQFNQLFETYRYIEEVFSFLSSVSIFSYSFYILYKKEKLFPKILLFDNLKWIYSFFKLTSFAYLFWIIALIIRLKLNFSGFIFSYYPLRIFTTIIIYLLGYQGLKHLRIFKERKKIRENILSKNVLVENFQEITPTKTNSNKTEKQFTKIDLHIKNSKKFLQPKYTLNNLSKEVHIGASTLSAIINKNANKSFIEYINEMRIEQSKKLLTDKEYENYTIVAIGLESGFNSKSTFYNVFKKHVGQTPLAYKSTQLERNLSKNT